MDWKAIVGLAGIVISAASRGIKVPPAASWAGIVFGISLLAWSFLPQRDQMPLGPTLLIVVAISMLVGGVTWYRAALRSPDGVGVAAVESPASSPAGATNIAIGGQGGSATAIDGGIAYAGPGGTAVAGGSGIGGAGGAATASGANSESAGGQGGSVGSATYWPHPAKSGYEVAQRAKGLPVDPFMRQFGRGGAVAGYEPKLAKVDQLRARYFAENQLAPRSHFEDINAVPVDYLNKALAEMGESWRVKIADDDEYDFYIP